MAAGYRFSVPTASPAAGLCATCRHSRDIVSGRGSRFVLCELSRAVPQFPRYPALPVIGCRGYARAGASDAGPRTLDASEGGP